MGVIHDMGGRMGYGAVAINVTKKCFINLGELSFRGGEFYSPTAGRQPGLSAPRYQTH
jgi:hypothetical protein